MTRPRWLQFALVPVAIIAARRGRRAVPAFRDASRRELHDADCSRYRVANPGFHWRRADAADARYVLVMHELVYVYILDEGTDVWRPVLSEDLGGSHHRLGDVAKRERDEL